MNYPKVIRKATMTVISFAFLTAFACIGLLAWHQGSIPTFAQENEPPPRITSVAITSIGGGETGTDALCTVRGTYRDYWWSGIYGIGDTIEITATFDKPITVTGNPSLTIDIGRQPVTAQYSRAKENTLVFSYTVAEGDNDEDGVSIRANQIHLNGGSITGSSGANADLSHNSLENQEDHLVDGIRPHIQKVAINSQSSQGHVDGGFKYHASRGDEVIISVSFNEATNFKYTDPRRGQKDLRPRILLDVGGQTREAIRRCSPFITWHRYTVQLGDFDEDGLQAIPNSYHVPEGGWIKDKAGNDAILAHGTNPARWSQRVDGHHWPAYSLSGLTINAETTVGVGNKLIVDTSDIHDPTNGMENAVFTYRWTASTYRWTPSGKTIPEANGPTYTPTIDDQGKHIRVIIRFSDDEGNPEAIRSEEAIYIPIDPDNPPPTTDPDPPPPEIKPTGPTGPTIYFNSEDTIPDQQWTKGKSVSLELPPARNAQNYAVELLPPNMDFDQESRTLSGIPDTVKTTPTPLFYSAWAEDPTKYAEIIFLYVVNEEPNGGFGFADSTHVDDQEWTKGKPVSLQLPESAGAVHYGIDRLPPDLKFEEATRTIAGIPSVTTEAGHFSNPGRQQITYWAWNADLSQEDSLSFGYTITEPDTNPVFRPTACAGPDQAGAPGAEVTLEGRCSINPYGKWYQMAHAWTQLSGPAVTLSDATVGNPSFTLPAEAADGTTLEFQLTVTDQEGESDSDTMTVTVDAPEAIRPTANAGPDLTGAPGESVTLQGTNSTNPYGAWWRMTHQWTQLSGPSVTLDEPTHGDPTFTIPADAAGGTTLEFQLTVTDKEGESDSDTVVVTVAGAEQQAVNTPPTASIDASQVAGATAGETVTLQGVGGDAETAAGSLTYAWSQVGGTPRVSIAGAGTAMASFTAPDVTEQTALTFRLTVTDEDGLSASADTTIDVRPPPTTPEITIELMHSNFLVVREGRAAEFEIMASDTTRKDLPLTLEIEVDGDFGVTPGRRTVLLEAGQGEIDLAFATDDDVGEANGLLTVTVVEGPGYTVGSPASAALTVSDNDGGLPLTGVSLDGIPLEFAPDRTEYLVQVAHEVAQTAVRTADGAVLQIAANGAPVEAGEAIPLEVGGTVINIARTSNGAAGQWYTVTITRAAADAPDAEPSSNGWSIHLDPESGARPSEGQTPVDVRVTVKCNGSSLMTEANCPFEPGSVTFQVQADGSEPGEATHRTDFGGPRKPFVVQYGPQNYVVRLNLRPGSGDAEYVPFVLMVNGAQAAETRFQITP